MSTEQKVDGLAPADGGPAFPIVTSNFSSADAKGITRLDYFAAKALPAWIAALSARRNEPGYRDEYAADEAARLAKISADAMLRARSEVSP